MNKKYYSSEKGVVNDIYCHYIKRIIDFVLAVAGIIVLSPVMLVIAFLVWKNLGSPIIFRQKRPGKNEEIFEMYKFRSMMAEMDKDGNLIPEEKRLTEFGKNLRATSLDELPELFNILKGEMSLVGPRPQLVKDMVFMTPKQRRRHSVRPGLTGLAQVNGRNQISWEEKFEWDLQYINHISFKTDVKIVLRTISKVIRKENITTDGMETAEDLGDYLLRKCEISKSEYTSKKEKLKIRECK